MTAKEIAAGLSLPGALQTAVFSLPVSQKQERDWLALFQQDQQAFERALTRQPAAELLVLALYLRWAVSTYDRYIAFGIPEAVFWDTFHDFALWSEECERITGHQGLIEWGWNALLLRMEIFRLGRLEYQPRTLDHDISFRDLSLPADTPVLEVHIPSGTPLRRQELLDSLCLAGPFFERYFQRSFFWFHCHSWLLSPTLRDLLPPASGIMQFQRFFTVYAEDHTAPQAEERVFGAVERDPREYAERTSLQRALKQHILHGNRVGMGMGICKRTSL